VGALLRGEVSLLERIPPDRVAGLASEAEIKVGRYSGLCCIGSRLDGRNPALRNRTLRRALSYAIDRPTLLHAVLGRLPDDANRISDGPFARGAMPMPPTSSRWTMTRCSRRCSSPRRGRSLGVRRSV